MTKEELEKWIEENNPYDPYFDEKETWEEGAKSMAEHLQSQPPSKEQIIGVLRYVYNELLPYEDILAEDALVEDILNNWNNED